MRETRGDWIQTYTGIKMFVMDPHPEKISIKDIAHALSNQCRFTGHTKDFYSIAQHSLLVAEIVPQEMKLCGLLHDASEAYLTDVARPVKRHLNNYQDIEEKLMHVIAAKYEFTWPPPPEIKLADNAALIAEQHYLFDFDIDGWTKNFENDYYDLAHKKYRVSMQPKEAEVVFLQAYKNIIRGRYTYAKV